MTYSKEIAREIIYDHLENPRHREKKAYPNTTMKNPACGDIITLYLLIENDIIKDIGYQIEGCSISLASASMMSELVKNKSTTESKVIANNFSQMLLDEKYDAEKLEEAAALIGIKDTPARIKCATLPYQALLTMIGDENE